MEHHSNIVPWQMIAESRGARVRFAPVLDDGTLDARAFHEMLSAKVKIVSLVHLSNALGTLNPLKDLFAAAHAVGAVCVADCAQSASLGTVDVRDLDCDFLVLSGHKVYAPTGVGLLYGKSEWLERLPPYQGGGSMIADVFEEKTTYLKPPHRFEAGTPPIAEVIGLGAAFRFMREVGVNELARAEQSVLDGAVAALRDMKGIRLIGTPPERRHVVSFLVEGTHPSDVGSILDEQGVAVRTGHHCCQPLMRRFGIPGTVRASFAIYNTEDDVKRFVAALDKAREMLT
jgi:cysteine desulfurase/selenocysteine lyase